MNMQNSLSPSVSEILGPSHRARAVMVAMAVLATVALLHLGLAILLFLTMAVRLNLATRAILTLNITIARQLSKRRTIKFMSRLTLTVELLAQIADLKQ